LASASFAVFDPDHRRNIVMPDSDPRFARTSANVIVITIRPSTRDRSLQTPVRRNDA